MTRKFLLAVAGLFLSLPAAAQSSAMAARTFGIEGMSCAFWLSGPMQARDGNAWILGYWAASNRLNTKNHRVGSRSSTDMIIVAVQEVCRAGASLSLPDATAQTYDRFQREGK
jgi:hypothetical protein